MLLLEEYRLRQTAFLSAVVNQAFSGLSKAQQYRIFSIGATPCLRNDVYIYSTASDSEPKLPGAMPFDKRELGDLLMFQTTIHQADHSVACSG